MITLQDFIAKWTGQPVDFDGIYPNQCVDLAQEWCRDGLNGPRLVGAAAIDIWTTAPPSFFAHIANTPENHPLPGDMVLWDGPDAAVGTSAVGHIGVAVSATATSFQSFDCDWPLGSLPHIQAHSYEAVRGWLRPVTAVPPPSPPAPQRPAAIHTQAEYLAASKIAGVDRLASNVPVADAPAHWLDIIAFVKAHT